MDICKVSSVFISFSFTTKKGVHYFVRRKNEQFFLLKNSAIYYRDLDRILFAGLIMVLCLTLSRFLLVKGTDRWILSIYYRMALMCVKISGVKARSSSVVSRSIHGGFSRISSSTKVLM